MASLEQYWDVEKFSKGEPEGEGAENIFDDELSQFRSLGKIRRLERIFDYFSFSTFLFKHFSKLLNSSF